METAKRIKVWDPAVRIFHWSLVFFFTLAYLSEDDLETVHAYAGYVVLALVLFRIVWGFIGTRYARFWNFIYSPANTIAYARSLLGGSPKHYLGHNPMGGWMVILLLISITLTCWTGLKAYAAEGKGPLANEIHLVTPAYADDDSRSKGKDGDEFWEEIHEFFANFTLLLIGLHIGGVIISSMTHRENLVRAMITGYKQAPPDNDS